ncbi:MAG: hypothetical protein Q9M92_13840 [Enterobacterales bacterium]|nr:hypothetical protein [Enterobacterales bacterium]
MKLLKLLILIGVILVGSLNFNSRSEEIKEAVLGMNVTGNKEAPNLLYIIPWKDNANDNSAPEINRLMDEVYSTVDPDVFEKEVIFYTELTSKQPIKAEDKN